MVAKPQSITASTLRYLAEAQASFEQRCPQDVIIACGKALQLDLGCALAYCYRGAAYLELGNQTAMQADFDQATAHDPNNAEMLYKIATVMAHLKHYPKTIALLGRVIELDATMQSAWTMLADSYLHVGRVDTASTILAHALGKFPGNTTLRLMQATLMPQIFLSADQGRKACAQFIQNLDSLMQEGFTLADPIAELPFFPFYHAYSGQNCKPLMEKLAAFFLKSCPSLAYEAPHCTQPRESKTPLRVGFVTELMHTDTIMMFFAQMLEGLAKDKALEVVLFSISRVPHSAGQELPQGIAKLISLPIHLPTIHETIAAEALDVLMYLDIGLGQCAYFTAFARLAPVQCTWGGHPVTTGIPSMDYFLTAEDAEPEQPEAHYTEKPVLLHNALAFHTPPRFPEAVPTRNELGLPEHMRLYTCPVQLFKLHPDMDAVFARILDKDPQACILLFSPPLPLWRPQLEARFAQSIPPALRQRIVFMPFVAKDVFANILRNVDAVLDPFHFSFGITAYLLFSLGIPFATWPGEFFRGRTAHFMYSRMDMPEMISPTQEAYADMAIRLANDKAFRASVAAKIRERSHVFYENHGAVDELAECLKRLYAA